MHNRSTGPRRNGRVSGSRTEAPGAWFAFMGIPMSTMLKVNLTTPNAGWMELVAVTQEAEVRVLASYTPNDFLSELVGALSLALQGASGSAVANGEPDIFEFAFEPKQDRAVSLKVMEYPGGRRTRQERIALTMQGSATEIVLPFWRALRSLQGRISPEDYAKAMQRTFPTSSLQRLSALLGKE
jgi:hypothetical protein